jgi:hypothetical protein
VTTQEDTGYTFTTGDFGFSDTDGNSLLAVKISTLPVEGTLRDNGVAVSAGQFVSAADITAGKLVFTPAADANGATYASFSFQVQDDGGTANGGIDTDATPNTMTVDVTAVNDAPTGADKTVTTAENTDYTFTASDFGFADPHDSPADNLLAVEITAVPTNGTLADSGVAVTAGQFVSVADITGGKLVFSPAHNASGTNYDSFAFKVQDDGGTANGGVDTSTSANTITVNVTAAGTPPNVAPSGADKTATTLEDTGYTFTTGDFGFSDSDGNSLAAVKITTVPAAGTLTDNGIAVTAGQFVSVADITGGKLVFTPAADANGAGYASFTFQVQDDGGTANGGIDTATAPNTITFDVTSVNDAPTGSDKTVTTAENTGYILTASDFGFADAHDSPANNLLAVEITALPTNGTLTDNGAAVTSGQFIAVADITGGKLVFTPATNATGTNYDSFDFKVQDDGGTANGGVDTATSANTITVNVTATPAPPNMPPSGADKTVTTLEDKAYAFTTSDFGFSDTDANSLQAVKISALPTHGVLTDNGVAVTAGQFVSVADITGGKLVFTPAADANGSAYASFTFQVQDNGGTASGGVDIDATPNTITIDVASVNDAPTGANKIVATLENNGYTFTASDFGFADPHDSPANNLLAVEITALPTNGTLTDNGIAVTAGQFVSVADITAGRLVFAPVLNTNGTNYASFDFKVQDDGGKANGGVDTATSANTITVNVTPTGGGGGGGGGNTNHPPTVAAPAGPLLTAEDTSLSIGGVTVSDADNDVLTTTLTVNDGTISVGGNGGGVSGDGTATLVITGTGAQIDAKLASLRYTPKSDWNGDDKLGIVVTDTSNASASSAVAIHVDDADVVNDALTTPENIMVSANVITGTNGASADIFEDPSRAITSVTQGAHGSVTFLADGTVAYAPDANFIGVDSFTYTVSANDGAVKTGTVTVTVTEKNNPPPVGPNPPANSLQGPWTTDEDVSLAITGVSVTGDATDVLTSTLTVNHGTLSVGGNGGGVSGDGTATLVITGTAAQINVKLAALGYKPIADYNGTDTLEISTKDGVTVTNFTGISVRPVADIAPDALATLENVAVTGNLLANDNFEGSPVVTSVTQGAHGQVAIGAGGNVTYTPAAGYVGADSFTYTVTSPVGVTETSVVNVQVAAIDPTPVRGDTDTHLTYAPPKSVQVALEGKVSETKNLLYVQPVVRHEALPTESITPVESEMRAVQKEAMLLAMAVDKAAAPEQASPLFDVFGLSAPKTEFVSPVQRAAEEAAKDRPQEHAKEKSSQADADRVHAAVPIKAVTEKHDIRVALTEVKAPRRAAPSFAAQLKRGNDMLRAAPSPSARH